MTKISTIFSITILLFLIAALPPEKTLAKIYKYKDKNGQWAYTNDPSKIPNFEQVEESEPAETPYDKKKKTPEEKPHKPAEQKNKIERARNATIAIKTAIGHGSGFFITKDGYILTNKHVVEGVDTHFSRMKDDFDAKQSKLEKEEKELKRETERLKKLEKVLKNEGKEAHPVMISTYNRDVEKYRNNLKKFKMRKHLFEEELSKFKRLKRRVNPYELTAIMADGHELPVSMIASSYQYDLSLLRVYGLKTPFLEPGDINALHYGDPLFVIGSPMHLSLKHTVTSGIFSGLRDFKKNTQYTLAGKFIQTNAQINRGNSGGPLLNEAGQVVGINTWIIRKDIAEGLNFAIPIDIALEEFKNHLGSIKKIR